MRFLSFSIRQAFQGLWRNRVMSLAACITMVLMLVLLASLVIVLSGMQAGLSYIESKVEVRAELLDGVPQDRVADLQARLLTLDEVAEVRIISKEEALAEFRAQRAAAGEADLTGTLGFNPFKAMISIKLRDPRQSATVTTLLDGEQAVVAEVLPQQRSIDRLTEVTSLMRTIGIVVLALVALTVLLIVVNSIRMAVMSRSQEIEIMRLVGASDVFVRWPFIFEGILIGLIGALATLGLLFVASGPITELARNVAGQVPVGFSETLVTQIAVLVLATGLGLGGFGARISVRAYLRN